MENSVEYFERLFADMTSNQEKLVDQAAEMLIREDGELAAIKQFMAKYDLPFENPRVSEHTSEGIIVGERYGLPLVLQQGLVLEVGRDGKVICESAERLSAFLKTADLETVKAGFDYVRKARYVDNNHIAERNRKLQQFLSDFPADSAIRKFKALSS
jgi:hypothetical protein